MADAGGHFSARDPGAPRPRPLFAARPGSGDPGGGKGLWGPAGRGCRRGAPAKVRRQPRGAAVSRELAGGARLRAAALPGRRRRRSAQARRAGFPGLQPAPSPAGRPPGAMAGCAARAPPGSEARLSLATFLLGASVLALPLLTRAGLQGRTGLALYVAGLNALLLLLYRPPRYQVRAGRRRAGAGARAGAWWVGHGARAPSPRGRGGPGAGPAGDRGRFPRACSLLASSGGRWDPASPGSGLGGRGPPHLPRSGWEIAVLFSSCGRGAWGGEGAGPRALLCNLRCGDLTCCQFSGQRSPQFLGGGGRGVPLASARFAAWFWENPANKPGSCGFPTALNSNGNNNSNGS